LLVQWFVSAGTDEGFHVASRLVGRCLVSTTCSWPVGSRIHVRPEICDGGEPMLPGSNPIWVRWVLGFNPVCARTEAAYDVGLMFARESARCGPKF
jgi:hypothetical protein